MQAAGGNEPVLKEISEFAPPSSDDICLGLRHRLAAISWLAINQTVSSRFSSFIPSDFTSIDLVAAGRVRRPTAAQKVMASRRIWRPHVGSTPYDCQDW